MQVLFGLKKGLIYYQIKIKKKHKTLIGFVLLKNLRSAIIYLIDI